MYRSVRTTMLSASRNRTCRQGSGRTSGSPDEGTGPLIQILLHVYEISQIQCCVFPVLSPYSQRTELFLPPTRSPGPVAFTHVQSLFTCNPSKGQSLLVDYTGSVVIVTG